MTLPQIIVDLMKLLFDMAVPAAMCTMVLAGLGLRQEGGVNFQGGVTEGEVSQNLAEQRSEFEAVPRAR